MEKRTSRESEEIISRSWVQRFCVRHAIVFKKLSGEAAGVPSATSDDWLSKVWPTIREGYSDSDVFNADETGLFYKLTPDRTLHFKGEKCSNGKLSKESITVLVAANMSGSEKHVPATTITNCFKHSGVLGNQNEEQPSEPAETNALDEPEFLPWSESLELPTLINKDVLADYAKIDEGLHTEQDISDEDLINELDADIETDNGEEDEEEQLDIPPLTDALRAA
ncbi:jerky protein homolog [Diorhabda sublineata]|uniref:jerky protein homolog n=1 Tax=Diorhabda sublineata TaxID=1163346 RepID=UPI0024E17C95|nr:jerky protein homolog [Diorhabda sublineata]